MGCCFSFEDLRGLGWIQSALSKLQPADWAAELGSLKHLTCDARGSLHLRTQLEVRSFVCAGEADQEAAASAVRYLSASREQREQAPSGMLSVLSYSVADAFNDSSPLGVQRQSKVKRQVLVYHTDLICLQGVDVSKKNGASLASTLTEEGYSFVSCSMDGEANTIFWDRSRWEMVRVEEGVVLSVNLRSLEDPTATIRALCFKAKAPAEATRFFMDEGKPLVVCADLSPLGGVESASIVEDLVGLPSVMEEVLGAEAAAHIPAPPGLSQDCELAPVRCTTGLNRLRFPDAIFFNDMAPVAALSGHTEGYLASMPPEDVVQQFPCFRLPIVAAFDWRSGRSGTDDRDLLVDIGLPPGLF